MQNRHLTGEETDSKTKEQVMEVNVGMILLTDLCLAMQSDPLEETRGLGEVLTCAYGPTVTYAFPDPLIISYRPSVIHVSLISILDGTAMNWCKQGHLRAQMSETVLFGEVKDPELIVLNFSSQLQCRMSGKRENPIEVCPKFWNLNPLEKQAGEILEIPTWMDAFDLIRKELEVTLERNVLPATLPEFPTVRRMTLGMNNLLKVPSV